MSLVAMRDLLDHAFRHNYAVGAFDLCGLEFLEGVISAAERCRAPVILNLDQPQCDGTDCDRLLVAAEAAAHQAVVPVAIHWDRGADIEAAVHAVNRGCNGVMVDAADRELGENIRITREIVSMAQGCGVAVEGKLGGAAPVGAGDAGEVVYTAVAEARAYVERTGVDFLAVSIGAETGRARNRPRLNWQRLKQLNETLRIPLVIHGGSGISDDQFRRLIANGVAKIHHPTLLVDTAGERLRAGARKGAGGDYRAVMREVRRGVEQEAERYMRLWGAAGRAAEVLEQCLRWEPLEHAVFHGRDGLADEEVAAVIEEGRRAFGTIPGVREVRTGEVVQSDRRFGWLLRVCHPAVIDAYREHPSYVAFARTRGDRLSSLPSVADGAGSHRPRPTARAQETASVAWSRGR